MLCRLRFSRCKSRATGDSNTSITPKGALFCGKRENSDFAISQPARARVRYKALLRLALRQRRGTPAAKYSHVKREAADTEAASILASPESWSRRKHSFNARAPRPAR